MFKNEKRTFKWAIACKFLYLMLLAGGCKENPQTAIALNPVIDECPQTPLNTLTPNNVKELSLGPQNLKESGRMRAGKSLGYLFKAESGQQLNYSSDDEICIWVYAPNNQLIVGKDLPMSGNYTIQVSTRKSVTTFTLEMSLESLPTANQNPATPPPPISQPISPVQSHHTAAPPPPNPQPIPVQPQHPVVQSVPPTSVKTTAEILDDMADEIFYQRYPQLRGRKIQPGETALVQEWAQIRRCDAVVDYRFYREHPELRGRKIIPGETDLQQDWWAIHQTVSGCH